MARRKRNGRRQSSSGDQNETVEDRLREEYAYVLRDLRQILILAALMFLLLIVLNLVI